MKVLNYYYRVSLVLVTLLMGCSESFAQLNYFLPDSNACFSVSEDKYWFMGDTVIGDLHYKKVYIQRRDSIANFAHAEYYAAVREDTLAERIYCIQTDDGVERLLADFSLKPGDTTHVYSFWPFFTPERKDIKVASVDSMMVNGQLRKRLNFTHHYSEHEWWVEGIGSSYGLFAPASWGWADLGDLPVLLCIHIEDELIFQHPHYSVCYLKDSGVGMAILPQKQIWVHPTITSENLYIESNYSLLRNYLIIDLMGRVQQQGDFSSTIIDVSYLRSGLYLLVLMDERSSVVHLVKFLKK